MTAPSSPAVAVDSPLSQERNDEDPKVTAKRRRRKQKAKTTRRQLEVASRGIACVYWSVICFLLAVAALILLAILLNLAERGIQREVGKDEPIAPILLSGPGTVFFYLVDAIMILLGVHGLLYVIGSILCCWIPPKSKARPYILVSVLLVGTGLILALVLMAVYFLADATGNSVLPQVIERYLLTVAVAAALSIAAGLILFMLFVRAVSFYLDQRTTARDVLSLLGVWILLTLAIFPLVLVNVYLTNIGIGIRGARAFAIGIGPFLTILWFAAWVWQWVRLLNLMGTIRKLMAYEFGV
jgi:hypothetical protein